MMRMGIMMGMVVMMVILVIMMNVKGFFSKKTSAGESTVTPDKGKNIGKATTVSLLILVVGVDPQKFPSQSCQSGCSGN